MSKRIVTMEDVAQAKEEKLAHYQEWLERGIISQREYDDSVRILNSLEGLLLFKSRKQELAQEAV